MAEPTKKKATAKGDEAILPPAPLPLIDAPADGVEKTAVPMTLDPSSGVATGSLVSAKVTVPAVEPLPPPRVATLKPEPLPAPVAAPVAAPRSATPAFEAEPLVYPPDAPNEREPQVPTLAEWLAAGYAEPGYYLRFGKNPTPNTPAPAPPKADPNAKRLYRVWPHGELHRDNVVYRPGQTLELTEAVATTIGPCVALAE